MNVNQSIRWMDACMLGWMDGWRTRHLSALGKSISLLWAKRKNMYWQLEAFRKAAVTDARIHLGEAVGSLTFAWMPRVAGKSNHWCKANPAQTPPVNVVEMKEDHGSTCGIRRISIFFSIIKKPLRVVTRLQLELNWRWPFLLAGRRIGEDSA